MAHYFVVVNTAHVPQRKPDGTGTDDGTYAPGDFIKGEQILARFNAVKQLGQSPIGMLRLRVGDM